MTQGTAFEILKKGYSVFITGPAGSGKTFLLKKYIEYCEKKGKIVAKTASTGIAATQMDGRTIHSWCGMGIKQKLTAWDIRNIQKDFNLKCRIIKTDVLVIDEISMLHAYQLDLVDQICRLFRDPFLPFGGLQVILCGDFFQIPPVSKGMEKALFAIYSKVWNDMNLKICYLKTLKRSQDNQLNQILKNIRDNKVDHHTLKLLLSRQNQPVKGFIKPTRIFTHNKDADAVNENELRAIEEPAFQYSMRSKGKDFLVQLLKQGCLAPEKLLLKKGAQVMFVKNNFEEGYANGSLGKVVGFTKNERLPIVRLKSGKKVAVMPHTWILEDNEDQEIISITQIPLRLAWAITVHKSQGMTLETVELSLGKSFEHGMGYVALSRAKSLEGINLLSLNELALRVNPLVIKIDVCLQQLSAAIEKKMQKNKS